MSIESICRQLTRQTWYDMKRRCTATTVDGYKNYGGRGITICDRWLNSYDNFIADMGVKPTPNHTIERINNDGNYEPSNCRWATKQEQRANRRLCHNAHLITVKGKTYTTAQAAAAAGVTCKTIQNRMGWGWPHEDVLLPLHPRQRSRKRRIEQIAIKCAAAKTVQAIMKILEVEMCGQATQSGTINPIVDGKPKRGRPRKQTANLTDK